MRWIVRFALIGLAMGAGYAIYRDPALVQQLSYAELMARAQQLRASLLPNQSNGAVTPAVAAATDKGSTSAPKGIKVVTQAVQAIPTPITIDGIGLVAPIASIPIKPRMDGQIETVWIADGAMVKKGDLLFTFDARVLKAQLKQAQAQIDKDQVQLDQAKRDLARDQDLVDKKTLPIQTAETQQSLVNQLSSQVAVDKAQADNFEALLSYAQIRAPVNGRIGTIISKEGAAVKSGDLMATVNQLDPIYVHFALPQSVLPDLQKAMAAGPVPVALKGAPAGRPNGTVAFIDNTVDVSTGTLQVYASMPNAASDLWPGALAKVQVSLGMDEKALVVPSKAVQIGQSGPYVFTVRDGKAMLTPVSVAREAGDKSVISDGLNAGDDVIVDGLMSLTNGADVSIAKKAAQSGAADASSENSGSTDPHEHTANAG
jgi:multidrug efflux system membrane fusion protein